jgi:hypothetical protein
MEQQRVCVEQRAKWMEQRGEWYGTAGKMDGTAGEKTWNSGTSEWNSGQQCMEQRAASRASMAATLNESHRPSSPLIPLSLDLSLVCLTLTLSLSRFSQTVTMTQRRIDSYFLRSSSSSSSSTASTVIEIDSDAPTDDDDDKWTSEDDTQPLPVLMARSARHAAARRAARRAQSVAAPQPQAVVRCAQPVVRRAAARRIRTLSDVTNERRYYKKKKSFYRKIRARFAHPANRKMCAYCGIFEHSSLHHEAEFKRAGTNIRAPSLLSPAGLAAEVKRCTRADGSVGLVALCASCHREAGLSLKRSAPSSFWSSRPWLLRSLERNRAADDAAKVARGQCECDDKCGRLVTLKNVGQFEWDHLVQSFDDPEYHRVSALVNSYSTLERCDNERKKCRLLFITCHQQHSGRQHRQAAERRAEESGPAALSL